MIDFKLHRGRLLKPYRGRTIIEFVEKEISIDKKGNTKKEFYIILDDRTALIFPSPPIDIADVEEEKTIIPQNTQPIKQQKEKKEHKKIPKILIILTIILLVLIIIGILLYIKKETVVPWLQTHFTSIKTSLGLI